MNSNLALFCYSSLLLMAGVRASVVDVPETLRPGADQSLSTNR